MKAVLRSAKSASNLPFGAMRGPAGSSWFEPR